MGEGSWEINASLLSLKELSGTQAKGSLRGGSDNNEKSVALLLLSLSPGSSLISAADVLNSSK